MRIVVTQTTGTLGGSPFPFSPHPDVLIVGLAIPLPKLFCFEAPKYAAEAVTPAPAFVHALTNHSRYNLQSSRSRALMEILEWTCTLSAVEKHRLLCRNKQISSTRTPASTVTISKQLHNRK
ncbi:hypothetical protein X777_04588 [Ooceraea biroi]|uniref:Uncharacterized protein n=1 Tax=Ooceraea biroi TaxID=2015173 RepID=A0A026X5W1_OOCBI|nr:hypothetical protein X777_04588 [Ooceraea biroi]